jgi:hypothetical protein
MPRSGDSGEACTILWLSLRPGEWHPCRRTVVGGAVGSDDYTRRPAAARGRVRARLVGRYRAHPQRATVQICCQGWHYPADRSACRLADLAPAGVGRRRVLPVSPGQKPSSGFTDDLHEARFRLRARCVPDRFPAACPSWRLLPRVSSSWASLLRVSAIWY